MYYIFDYLKEYNKNLLKFKFLSKLDYFWTDNNYLFFCASDTKEENYILCPKYVHNMIPKFAILNKLSPNNYFDYLILFKLRNNNYSMEIVNCNVMCSYNEQWTLKVQLRNKSMITVSIIKKNTFLSNFKLM